MRWRNVLLVLIVMLMGTLTSRAQTTPGASPGVPSAPPSPPAPVAPGEKNADAVEELKTYVYNVSELVRATEDYPLQPAMIPSTRLPGASDPGMAPGMGGGGFVSAGGPEGQPVAQSTVNTVDAISDLITESVSPDSWSGNGGVGRIKPFSRSLIITQTEANHTAIKKLLEQLQKEAAPSRMVSVRAYWLLLSANDLPNLGESAKQQKKSQAMLEVPNEMLNGTTIYSQGQTLCFNGQTVHISSGRGHTIVTGATPVVGQSTMGYQFSTAVVQNGVALQVKPDITPDGKLAVLDLQSIVSELPEAHDLANAAKPSTTTQASADLQNDTAFAKIDRVNVTAQQFRTTVRIPLDKKILIGGMTMEPTSAGEPARNLYLVVEVSAGD